MKNRREFLSDATLLMLAVASNLKAKSPEESARDEKQWIEIAQSFAVRRDVIDLNHAAASSLSRPVMDAVIHYTREVERLPSYNIFQCGPQLELIRASLAKMFACDSEEVAIVRNTTEALNAVLLGVPLQAGDEVVTTTQDYWAMLDALDQRSKRDGIVVKKVYIPSPASTDEELVEPIRRALTDRTRLILVTHPLNLNGQHVPVAKISRMAHEQGIEVVVDAAQSFGQLELTAESLGCDYMGTSLHKWLMGPKGTGMLYVRRDKISKVWPLFAAGKSQKADNVRKFEMFGTGPMTALGLFEAIRFHQTIGTSRIAARLNHLTHLWADALRQDDRFEFKTSFAAGMSNAIATVHIKGTNSADVWARLYQKERILGMNVARRTREFQGVRISVGLATTPDELGRFSSTMQKLAREMPSQS